MQWKNIKQQMRLSFERSGSFDPITFISKKLFFGSPFLTAVMVAVITMGVEVLMGEASQGIILSRETICAMYPQVICPKNLSVVHYFEPAELYFALFLWGVFTPIVWWYYLSTPRMWGNMIESLQWEKVVDTNKLRKIIAPVLNNSFWLPTLGITIFILFLYIFGSIPSEIERGRVSFWLLTRQGGSLLIFFIFIHSFTLISFALKSLILIVKIRRFFNQNEIKAITVFHVDQCGGFGSIGILATQISSLAVMIGVYAIWYSALPVMSGGDFNFGISVLVLYGAYAFFVPIFLITLTSPVAQAMKRYKQKLLMRVSRQLQMELENIVSDSVPKRKDTSAKKNKKDAGQNEYKKLQELYAELSQIPESPIRLLNLKRFTVFAIFPALFGSVSFLLSIFDLLAKFREWFSA